MLKAMKENDNMRYGIICAMDEELKDLLENLEDRTDKKVGVTEFYTGKINGKEVVFTLRNWQGSIRHYDGVDDCRI